MTRAKRRHLRSRLGLDPLLHLAALWALAVAQPLYDLLTRNPAVLLTHRAGVSDLVILIAFASFTPPLFLAGLVVLVNRRLPAAAGALLHLLIGLLAAFAVLPPLDRAFLRMPWMIACGTAGAFGVAVAMARVRARVVRHWLSLMAIGALIFPAVFLLNPAVRTIASPDELESAHAPVPDPHPVIVIVFDEFPVTSIMDAAGRLDAARYPGFGALARRSTWYRNASSVALSTLYALPAIVAGVRPSPGRLPIAADYPHNLFTLLGPSFAITALEPETRLCPAQSPDVHGSDSRGSRGLAPLLRDATILAVRAILPRALNRRLPPLTGGFQDFSLLPRATPQAHDWSPSPRADLNAMADRFGNVARGNRTEDFQTLLTALTPRPRAALYFVHCILPHGPWIYLPSGRTYAFPESPTRGFEDNRWVGPSSFIAESYARHLLQVQYADTLVSRLLRRLDELKMTDDALLVVTADHGISFRPGEPSRLLSDSNWPDLLGVPLFIKYPGRSRTGIDDRSVEQVDILPTIAGALHITLPWPVDGRSLLVPTPPEDNPKGMMDEWSMRTYVKSLRRFLSGRREALRLRKSLLDPDGGPAVPPSLRAILGHAPVEPQLTAWGAATIGEAALLQDIPSHTDVLPAWVTGKIVRAGSSPPPAFIVLAFDGILRQPMFFDVQHGDVVFGGLLPESLLHPGRHALNLFVIPSGGPPWRLIPATLAPEQAVRALQSAAGSETLVLGDGTSIPVDPGPLEGRVERRWLTPEGTACLLGWAADRGFQVPAERIVAVVGRRILATARPSRRRTDVARVLQCAPCADSGFEIVIPESRLAHTPLSKIRLYGILAGRATELRSVP